MQKHWQKLRNYDTSNRFRINTIECLVCGFFFIEVTSSPVTKERGRGFCKTGMTAEQKIEQVQLFLGDLNRLRVNLEYEGIPPDDPLFDLIAIKAWTHIFTWEVYASALPKNQFTIGEFVMTVPPISDYRTRSIYEVIGFQNLDYHFYMRNNKHMFNGN